jgi:hypothetical protein
MGGNVHGQEGRMGMRGLPLEVSWLDWEISVKWLPSFVIGYVRFVRLRGPASDGPHPLRDPAYADWVGDVLPPYKTTVDLVETCCTTKETMIVKYCIIVTSKSVILEGEISGFFIIPSRVRNLTIQAKELMIF